MVPMAGVEPAQLAPLPPQGSVSTNFTTSADVFIQAQQVLLEYLAFLLSVFQQVL